MSITDYDLALERALLSQPESLRVVIDSPPGAGKTGVVEHVAVQSVKSFEERVMIAAQTRSQCLDLASRLAKNWSIPVYLLWPKSKELPKSQSVSILTEEQEPAQKAFFKLVYGIKDLPDTPHVAIATSAKWNATNTEDSWFDLQIVEEAYQLTDTDWRLFSSMAKRHFLVGDPGQIAPVVSISTLEWEASKEPPHYPAPFNLLKRFPSPQTTHLKLPASRRLPGDSAYFVSDLLYPTLNFKPTSFYPDRAIKVASKDPSIDLLNKGNSLLGIENKSLADATLKTEMLIKELLDGNLVDKDIGIDRKIVSADIGIVCTRTKDVQTLQSAVAQQGWNDIFCETAERFQGLEREIIFVFHPFWDSQNVDFALDAGKWCVMLSRHRVACIIMAPENIDHMLDDLKSHDGKRFYAQSGAEQGLNVHKSSVTWLEQRGLWQK